MFELVVEVLHELEHQFLQHNLSRAVVCCAVCAVQPC